MYRQVFTRVLKLQNNNHGQGVESGNAANFIYISSWTLALCVYPTMTHNHYNTIIVPGRPNAAHSLLALVLAILARTRCCLWFDVMRKTNFAGSSSTNYGAQKERKTLTGGICPLRRFTGHREHANSGGRSYCDGFENGTGVVYAEHVRATESGVDCWCVDCPEHWRLKGS